MDVQKSLLLSSRKRSPLLTTYSTFFDLIRFLNQKEVVKGSPKKRTPATSKIRKARSSEFYRNRTNL